MHFGWVVTLHQHIPAPITDADDERLDFETGGSFPRAEDLQNSLLCIFVLDGRALRTFLPSDHVLHDLSPLSHFCDVLPRRLRYRNFATPIIRQRINFRVYDRCRSCESSRKFRSSSIYHSIRATGGPDVEVWNVLDSVRACCSRRVSALAANFDRAGRLASTLGCPHRVCFRRAEALPRCTCRWWASPCLPQTAPGPSFGWLQTGHP